MRKPIDMGGLSITDPERYRKINYVLNDRGVKKDLLDRVETVPIESSNIYSESDIEDRIFESKLKIILNDMLATLPPREERCIRRRFGIGDTEPSTYDEIGVDLWVTGGRVMQLTERAIRRLKHPSRLKKFK